MDRVEFDGFPAWSLVPLPTWEECGNDGKLYGLRMGLAKDYNQCGRFSIEELFTSRTHSATPSLIVRYH